LSGSRYLKPPALPEVADLFFHQPLAHCTKMGS